MRLGNNATAPLRILASVLEGFGVEFKSTAVEADSEALGINIHSEDFPDAAASMQPEEDVLGWLGYEDDDEGPRLSVYFYCSGSCLQQLLRQFTEAQRQGTILGTVEQCAGDPGVVIWLPATE